MVGGGNASPSVVRGTILTEGAAARRRGLRLGDHKKNTKPKIYQAASKRLLEVVEALDGKEGLRNFDPWKKMVEERSGSLPEGMRWFLLNKLFQMRPAEIARMEGVKNPSAVRGLIIRVSDQLRCGEISLFEKDPEEAEAAKAKLEAERKKRRERYAERKGGGARPHD